MAIVVNSEDKRTNHGLHTTAIEENDHYPQMGNDHDSAKHSANYYANRKQQRNFLRFERVTAWRKGIRCRNIVQNGLLDMTERWCVCITSCETTGRCKLGGWTAASTGRRSSMHEFIGV